MENPTKPLDAAVAIAQFRLGLISPVIYGTYPDVSRNAYYRRITEKPLTLPDGSVVQYSPKTISKWMSLYQTGGFDALMPKGRSDKGSTRALSSEAISEIYRLRMKFPKLNATQIYIRLVQDSFINATVNVSTVQRFIRNNDLKSARSPSIIDRKAFEEDAFGKMWQADTCYLPPLKRGGNDEEIYHIAILDDHSRVVVGSGLFYSDNAYNFQKVLRQAVEEYGIPAKLYVDNGKPYSNTQLSLICGELGISLIHTKVRDPSAKGKIERYWSSQQSRLIDGLDMNTIHSLDEYNSVVADYVRCYNKSFHRGINEAPLERFERSLDQGLIRKPSSREWLDECFMNRTERKVKKDSTISIDKVWYDVPGEFIGNRVEVRYLPGDMSSAYIFFEGKHFPISPTDRNENCRHRKKKSTPSLDYSKMGGGEK